MIFSQRTSFTVTEISLKGQKYPQADVPKGQRVEVCYKRLTGFHIICFYYYPTMLSFLLNNLSVPLAFFSQCYILVCFSLSFSYSLHGVMQKKMLLLFVFQLSFCSYFLILVPHLRLNSTINKLLLLILD